MQPEDPVAPNAEVIPLQPGHTLEETLELPARQYFEIEFEQIEGDATVELVDPDGTVVAVSALPGKPWVPEILAVVTSRAGEFRLRIRAETNGASVAELRRETREAGPAEHALAAALARREEAIRLKELETREGLASAVAAFEETARQLDHDGSEVWLGRVLRELGRCQQRLGSIDEAEENYRESIALLRQAAAPRQLAESLNYHGVLLLERGDRPAARMAFVEALQLARQTGDAGSEAETWNNLGVYHYYEGDMERVVGAFEQSLAVGRAAGRLEGRANTLANLGEAYRSLGRYADALELSQQSLDLARRLGDAGQEMRVLNNRGVLLKGVGDLRGAVEDYESALELARRSGDVRWEASISRNLGAIYRLMGHRKRALEYLEKALDAAVSAQSANDEIWALLTIGELLREDRDDTAETVLQRARRRSQELDDATGEAYSLYGLGRISLDADDGAASAEYLTQALALLEGTSDRPGQLAAHRELARALASTGDERAAGRHFDQAVALARLLGDPHQEAVARARRARFRLDAGDPVAAEDDVSLALATIESLRRGVVEPDLRAGLLSRSQEDFTLMIDILETLERQFPRQGYLERAFAVAERARARSLIELLTESEADLIRDLPPDLGRRRSDLTGRLSAAQRSLTRELGKERFDPSIAESLRQDVQELNLEREGLEREIRLSDHRWDRLVYPEPVDLAGAQRLLGPSQAFVSFVLGEHGSFVFVITPTDLVVERIPSEGELRAEIEALRRHLERPGRRSIGRFRVVASDLYSKLLEPVEHLLEDHEHLLISPDGLLHYIPFEALVRPRELQDPDAYLLSTWAVSYLPSASALEVLKNRPVRERSSNVDLAAFADPQLPGSGAEAEGGEILRGLGRQSSWNWRRLAGARHEVEAISGLFEPHRRWVALGEAATEGRFRREEAVREARYVHLASHALIDSAEPALSALLLTAGSPEEDGLLQAHEVFELELNADLVVLSGCETALGRAVRGEGLLGMTRAFLYAGADAVAVSLWPVEDRSTSELMVGFYRGLTRGEGAPQALRQAKLARLADPRYRHPYYWAPFVVVGSPS